jgi:hypothetical protein
MLIDARETIELAYITLIDDTLIKDEIIDTAEKTWIKPVLSEPLYNAVTADPSAFTLLINSYIKPCLAFYVKYLIYSQQIFETAEYSSPEQNKAVKLFDPAAAPLITWRTHYNIIRSILFIARQKEQILKDHINSMSYEAYVKPIKRRVSGILINN